MESTTTRTFSVAEPAGAGAHSFARRGQGVQGEHVELFGGAGNAGAVMMVTIKSGSNDFRGSAFEYFRHDTFDARDTFNYDDHDGDGKADPEKLRRHQFGGTFGGPTARNRTFFFGSWAAIRLDRGLVDLVTVPTALERQGFRSAADGPRDPRSAHRPTLSEQHDSERPDRSGRREAGRAVSAAQLRGVRPAELHGQPAGCRAPRPVRLSGRPSVLGERQDVRPLQLHGLRRTA